MDAEGVFQAFSSARASTDDDYRIVIPTSQDPASPRLAISRDGVPALLVPLRRLSSEAARFCSGVSFRGTPQIEFNDADGGRRIQSAAIFECRDRSLLRTFSAMTAALVARLSMQKETSWAAICALFDEWERLFARRKVIAHESQIGLWGELWCISRSDDQQKLLEGWQGPEGEKLDFIVDGTGLEIKTTRQPLTHSFSQSQIESPAGRASAFVMSIYVAADAGQGKSLPDLIAELASTVTDLAIFEEKLAAVGYCREDDELYRRRFLVLEEPLFFDLNQIPRVRAADPGVSDIRFRAELRRETALPSASQARFLAPFGLRLPGEYPCA